MQLTDGGQVEDREAVLHFVRRQLIGPVDGEHELLLEPPHRRYLTGILFPTDADGDEGLQDDIQDDAAGDVPGEVGEDQSDDPVLVGRPATTECRRSQLHPSHLGTDQG